MEEKPTQNPLQNPGQPQTQDQPIPEPTQPSNNNMDTPSIIAILLLLFFYPVGIIIMWFATKWPKWVKFIITLPIILAFIGIALAIFLIAKDPLNRFQKTPTNIAVQSPTPDPASNAAKTMANWKTYTNSNLTFKYPSTWIIKNTKIGSENLTSITGESINIDVVNPNSGYFLAECMKQTSTENENGFYILHLSSDNNGGQCTGNSTTGRRIMIVPTANSSSPGIYFDYNSANETKAKDIFNQILSTFKFTDQTSQNDSTSNWKTYVSDSEHLSFKYPQEWTLDTVPCVNSTTQQKAECVQVHSPKDTNGVPITIYYQYNDPGENYVNGLKVEEMQPLNIANSKKSLYLVTADTDFQTSQVGLYAKPVAKGDIIPNLTFLSQADNQTLVKMIAYLQKGVQQSEPYTLAELKNHPNYNEALAIFRSLSY
jgi:hypothetical protein